jgi:hypothetical protein
MTMLCAVSGGRDVLVLASDGAHTNRDLETGAERPSGSWPAYLEGQLYPLSVRRPLAFGGFGLTGSRAWGPERSIHGAMARCRARFDAELPAADTMEEVAGRVALELFETFGELLRGIVSRRWADPAGMPAGAHPGGTFVGGLVAGYPGNGGPAEGWFVLATADGVQDVVRKFRGSPDGWGVAITPGADAAAAVYKQVINEVPRTHDRAAEMARALIEIQIAAPRTPAGPTVGGPVQLLGLTPGRAPWELAA